MRNTLVTSPSRISLAKRLTKVFFFFLFKIHLQDNHFGMFIVLKLHRESLRQMMKQGRVSHSIKIKVLKMLRPQVCGYKACHGDIKDLLVFNN